MPFIRFSRDVPRRLTARLASLRRDTVGAVAAVVAISAPVLIGSMGLGGEAGYWYLKQRSLQNAADVAAHGSAIRLAAGDDSAAIQAVAEYIAESSDIDLANADLDIYNPPISGGFIEDGDAIEIVITESVPRLFSAMYSTEPLQISARAVATAQGGGTGCVLALSETEEGAITISGSVTSLTMCDMISNAVGTSFVMDGEGSSVSANCIQTVGTAELNSNVIIICDKLRENANPALDPFASVAEPAAVGACQDGNVGQNNQTTNIADVRSFETSHPSGMPSMRFCNGLTVSGTTHFDPGLYIVEGGDFQINSNANVTGDGIIFYLADGVETQLNGTANISFTPPTSGVYAGIVIFGSRSSTEASHTLNGNLGSVLDGVVYAPESHISWSGNVQTSFTGCTQIIGDTVTFSGNGAISIHCLFPIGPTIEVAGEVKLVE